MSKKNLAVPVNMCGNKVGRTAYNLATKAGVIEFATARRVFNEIHFNRKDFSEVRFQRGAVFNGCVFNNCSFVGASLTHLRSFEKNTVFYKCDFSEANLTGSYIGQGFTFIECVFNGVVLEGSCVDLLKFLTGIHFNHWRVFDKLTVKSKYFLMRFDQMTHPNPSAFTKWAEHGGMGCPYDDGRDHISSVSSVRPLQFNESNRDYASGKRSKYQFSVVNFFRSVCKDLCIKID